MRSNKSALFAAIESQLLTFVKGLNAPFKPTSPSGQALILLTYLSFLFSISAAVSSLILTDELGELQMRASNVPPSHDYNVQVLRLSQEHRSETGLYGALPTGSRATTPTPEIEQAKQSQEKKSPRERGCDCVDFVNMDSVGIMQQYGIRDSWKFKSSHCTPFFCIITLLSLIEVILGFLMLLLAYLCLVAQLLVYIWSMESLFIGVFVSVSAFGSILPLMSFSPWSIFPM